ncbi:spore coat protein [Paenibacillus piri]|uniref:Spore coat protein n=1 Tax=Paenibacillus piri TaxID=2547395 RepID=A0A4R5KRR6_9BACL|nr:spore coat protein [Paenibacillus piri]TDF97675.1 spore coat protein [Paenibacillus piri]
MDIESLSLLVGRTVRIDRGGPESKTGKLLSAKVDHLVLSTENEGTLYYQMAHIKSLTLDARDVSDLTDVPPPVTEEEPTPIIPRFIDVEQFNAVMENMVYRWVQINRGGPEKIEGVLIEASSDEVKMVVGNEVIHILPFHVRNVSFGLAKKNDQNKNDQNKNDQNKKDGNKQEAKEGSK